MSFPFQRVGVRGAARDRSSPGTLCIGSSNAAPVHSTHPADTATPNRHCYARLRSKSDRETAALAGAD
jgi:hypothetical protein